MNVAQCQNGHFFDTDSYSTCPHCGSSAIVQTAGQGTGPQEKRKFWGIGKKKEKHQPAMGQSAPIYEKPDFVRPEAEVYSAETPTDAMQSGFTPSRNEPQKDLTLDFWNNSAHDEEPSDDIEMPQEVQHQKPIEASQVTESGAQTISEQPVQSSLRDAVQKVSSSGGGKTMSYFSSAVEARSEESHTQGPIDPVVGWLVCVSGLHLGDSFCIHAGKNSLGREAENNIVIGRDPSVSRIKHAEIIYEPKKRNFYLKPGDGSGLTYLNEEYIMDSKVLQRGDVIEIGNSQFLFVPLCSDDFSWEKYIKKEN